MAFASSVIPSFFLNVMAALYRKFNDFVFLSLFLNIVAVIDKKFRDFFLNSLRPKEKLKYLGDSGKQKVPGNKQKTTFRQKVVFLRHFKTRFTKFSTLTPNVMPFSLSLSSMPFIASLDVVFE